MSSEDDDDARKTLLDQQIRLLLDWVYRMSSSDEEVVRRPGRSGKAQSPAESEHNDGLAADDMDVDKPNGGDDDADLFGSDGSEGGFGDEEYV